MNKTESKASPAPGWMYLQLEWSSNEWGQPCRLLTEPLCVPLMQGVVIPGLSIFLLSKDSRACLASSMPEALGSISSTTQTEGGGRGGTPAINPSPENPGGQVADPGKSTEARGKSSEVFCPHPHPVKVTKCDHHLRVRSVSHELAGVFRMCSPYLRLLASILRWPESPRGQRVSRCV